MIQIEREKLERVLDALEDARTNDDSCEKWDRNKEAITAVKEALAQPEQPIIGSYLEKDNSQFKFSDYEPDGMHHNKPIALYTTPPAAQPAQRPWVGLTNNELQPIADEYRILFGSWVEDFARAIEAKLKEKNA